MCGAALYIMLTVVCYLTAYDSAALTVVTTAPAYSGLGYTVRSVGYDFLIIRFLFLF